MFNNNMNSLNNNLQMEQYNEIIQPQPSSTSSYGGMGSGMNSGMNNMFGGNMNNNINYNMNHQNQSLFNNIDPNSSNNNNLFSDFTSMDKNEDDESVKRSRKGKQNDKISQNIYQNSNISQNQMYKKKK